jgi:RNA recognition motif-containing protein
MKIIYISLNFSARRALDQSNGAMFLNRKLIVQLSTSRFRPQPKETSNSLSQPPKQLMVMGTPASSIAYHHLNNEGGSTIKQQQQPNTLTQQYPNGKDSVSFPGKKTRRDS